MANAELLPRRASPARYTMRLKWSRWISGHVSLTPVPSSKSQELRERIGNDRWHELHDRVKSAACPNGGRTIASLAIGLVQSYLLVIVSVLLTITLRIEDDVLVMAGTFIPLLACCALALKLMKGVRRFQLDSMASLLENLPNISNSFAPHVRVVYSGLEVKGHGIISVDVLVEGIEPEDPEHAAHSDGKSMWLPIAFQRCQARVLQIFPGKREDDVECADVVHTLQSTFDNQAKSARAEVKKSYQQFYRWCGLNALFVVAHLYVIVERINTDFDDGQYFEHLMKLFIFSEVVTFTVSLFVQRRLLKKQKMWIGDALTNACGAAQGTRFTGRSIHCDLELSLALVKVALRTDQIPGDQAVTYKDWKICSCVRTHEYRN